MSDFLGDFAVGDNVFIERCFVDGSTALPTAVVGGSACCKNMRTQILLNSGVGAITTSGGLATLTIFTGSGASYVKGDYSVYMGAGTVTGTSVIGYTLAQFSIGRDAAVTYSTNVVSWNGTAVSTPATAGIPDINVKNINNVSASPVTTVKAVQGLTTADTIVTYTGNTLQTADVAARTPSALTANGNMKSSMVEILTTALTETAGLLAGGFKKFFNIASPVSTMDVVARVTLVDTLTTYTGNTVQTGDSFARIGVAGAGLTNIDLPNQTMDIVGNITGNLSGSIGSLPSAYDFAKGTVAMTESYAADLATMTPVQALHMIWANAAQFAISTTSISVKKLDGTSEAMNFDLDSSTVPTLRNRNV